MTPQLSKVLRKTPTGLHRCKSKPKKRPDYFKDHIPLNICWEVEGKAEDLWHMVKSMPKEYLHQEVADWVLDPDTTMGRATAYDRLLMQYWFNMKMVGHSYMEHEAKQVGDEEPIKA